MPLQRSRCKTKAVNLLTRGPEISVPVKAGDLYSGRFASNTSCHEKAEEAQMISQFLFLVYLCGSVSGHDLT
jgi:hypothetical protein